MEGQTAGVRVSVRQGVKERHQYHERCTVSRGMVTADHTHKMPTKTQLHKEATVTGVQQVPSMPQAPVWSPAHRGEESLGSP